MTKKNNLFLITGIILLIFSISACTVNKKKGEMSGAKRFYHNLTAKYNGYFNANELIIKSENTLKSQVPNDYSAILPVFPYMEAPNASAVFADCDLVIEKLSRVVALHGESYWVDDSYLLVGKSQFLKQDYESAEQSLLYLQQEFENGSQRASAKMTRAQKAKLREVKQKERQQEVKEKVKEREKVAKEREKTKKQLQKERKNTIKQRQKDAKKGVRPDKSKTQPVAPPAPLNETKKEPAKAQTIQEKIVAKEEEKAKADAAKAPSNKYEGKFKHRIIYDNGLLLLAQTYIKRKQYLTAKRLLNRLEADPDIDKSTRKDIAKVNVYFHIDQEEYAKAIPYLQSAITLEKQKTEKARLTFILAQLYEKARNYKDAQNTYDQVVKLKPEYELSFSAKINSITAGLKGGGASKDKAISDLIKLSKDPKNEDYEDRIYYYVGEVELENNNIAEAKKNFKLAVRPPSSTPTYKILSYHQLGDLYFNEENYLSAKLYYDSTLVLMTGNSLKKTDLEKKRNSIREIADNIQMIELQDSLIRISKMTPEEQEAIALDIRNKRIQEKLESQKQTAATGAKPNMGGGRMATAQAVSFASPGSGGNVQAKSEFFAYDDKILKKGIREFENKWGSRALQDDWRRSRRSGAEDKAGDEGGIASSVRLLKKSISKSEVDQILSGVPKTDEDIAAANKKIETATFKIGKLYREKLEYYAKSAEVLEKFLKDFPHSDHELEALFLLHLNYNELKDYAKANYYKEQIFKKYKNSDLAKALSSQLTGEKTIAEKAKDDYDNLYAIFQSGDYETSVNLAKEGERTYQKLSLQPKFALIGAMSIGNVEGRDAYINELKRIVTEYKRTPEQIKASEILRLLGQATESIDKVTFVEGEAAQLFKPEDDKFHYAMVIWKNGKSSFEEAKNSISNFNQKYYRLENLKTSSITLDINTGTQLILIRTFTNAEKSMKYFNEAQKRNKEFFPNPEQGEIFVITQNNYREILKLREADLYRTFFSSHYLTK